MYCLVNLLLFFQITKTYSFLTPDLWREIPPSKYPYDEHSAHLQLAAKKAGVY